MIYRDDGDRLWFGGGVSTRRLAALFGVVAILVLVATGVVAQRRAGGPGPTIAQVGLLASVAIAYGALGMLVLRHVPGHRVGWLMAAIGAAAGLSAVSLSWVSWAPAAWFSQWSWWVPLGLVPLALLIFPDGRLPSRRWRPLAILLGVSAATVAVTFGAAAASSDDLLFAATGASGPARTLLQVAFAAVAVEALAFLGVLASLVTRWRRAVGTVRAQLLFLVAAGVAVLFGLVLDTLGLEVAWVVTGIALPLAMTLAILRHHLYDLDLYLNRALVWLLMSLAVVGAYVLLVDVVGRALSQQRLASIVGTALVAVTFEPARRWLQRAVDRLLFGRRDDPYGVLSELGRHLEEIVRPAEVLPRLVSTIVQSLQVPYVAVEIRDSAGLDTIAAEQGRLVGTPEPFPLVAHGQTLGALLVAPRRAGEAFSDRERALLQDLARQAAVAVEAHRLTLDLQHSRERLVIAREEERRRLRSELHDGVGPGLAGMAMQVRAARRLLDADQRPATILDGLSGDLERCGVDIRRLVDALRPASLDHGLAGALRQEAARFGCDELTVDLDCPSDLDGLPAAVEVAAFRIATEALTNAARHSAAHTCRITLRRTDSLQLDIVDDGNGVPAQRRDGVGLTSMRERAEELGGTFQLGSGRPHGTRVSVRLPLSGPVPAPVPAQRRQS